MSVRIGLHDGEHLRVLGLCQPLQNREVVADRCEIDLCARGPQGLVGQSDARSKGQRVFGRSHDVAPALSRLCG